MKELKNWWAVILLMGGVACVIAYVVNRQSQFVIKVQGEFLGPRYEVSVPMKWMTPELAQKHHEAYFRFAENLPEKAK